MSNVVQQTGNLTVILNGYRRPHTLKEQYEAVTVHQTIKPAEVMFWQNKGPAFTPPFNKTVVDSCVSFVGNANLGVWARFAFALMAKTKYVCIFDDDTIPGNRWFENCIVTNKTYPGLHGTVGVVFDEPDKGYAGKYHRVGWPEPNENVERADIVGHSWFFERELLTYFWRELPDPKFDRAGEDIHFSHMIQKYLPDLGTFVPPHPKDDKSLWGSQPESAMKIGMDNAAISMDPTGFARMNECVQICRKGGYRFLKDQYTLVTF